MATDTKQTLNAEEFKLRLQLETMLLVWLRTSLALMGFGFVIARFGLFLHELANAGSVKITAHPGLGLINNITGTLLILAGVVVMLLSIYSYREMITRLERGELNGPSRWSFGVFLGIFVATLGLGMAAYLLILEL